MRIVRMVLAVLTAAAGAVVALQAPASAATQGPYELHPWGGIFWCAKTESGALSAPVILRHCGTAGNNYQRWMWTDTTNGYYRIRNVQTNKCLNAAGGVTTGTRVIQYNCTTSALNDQWKPVPKQTGSIDYYLLQNRLGNLCLQVATASGEQLSTGSCNTATRSDWWTWD